jgi:hypothetical protein
MTESRRSTGFEDTKRHGQRVMHVTRDSEAFCDPAGHSMSNQHLHDELLQNPARITVETRHGPITGGRASNAAAVFLGAYNTDSGPSRLGD